jgi:ubiquinone/menaquinone biosynthesis C-methylase UbiE
VSDTGDVTASGVFRTVLDGYEAVYDALGRGPTFTRLWQANAYHDDFPAEFAHIGFLTLPEARRVLELLRLDERAHLVDVACGAGGPGLWVAREARVQQHIGIDPSPAGLDRARRRAADVGLADRARFAVGTFAHTGLPDASADAVMTIEAFQYAPDKRAALAELHRILEPGGRLAIVAFEVDRDKVVGVPVLGDDAVPDYTPLLEAAGFTIVAYEETPGWKERVDAAFRAIVEHADQLRAEMGERAAGAALAEATLTVQLEPYLRRVLIVAERLPTAT